MVWPEGVQKIGVMTSGLVDGVIITGPPWKISGGVPLAGSLFLMAALATQGPPVGRTMPAMCPIRGCGEQAFGGGGAALAAMGVAIASMLPATRVRAAPRPHRLCAFFILPPGRGRGGHPGCLPDMRHKFGQEEHTLSPERKQDGSGRQIIKE